MSTSTHGGPPLSPDFNVERARGVPSNTKRHFFRTRAHWQTKGWNTTLRWGGRGPISTYFWAGVIFFANTGTPEHGVRCRQRTMDLPRLGGPRGETMRAQSARRRHFFVNQSAPIDCLRPPGATSCEEDRAASENLKGPQHASAPPRADGAAALPSTTPNQATPPNPLGSVLQPTPPPDPKAQHATSWPSPEEWTRRS